MSAASVGATAVDAVCGVAGVAVLLVAGFGPVPAGVSLALLVFSFVGSVRLAALARRGGTRVIAGVLWAGESIRREVRPASVEPPLPHRNGDEVGWEHGD